MDTQNDRLKSLHTVEVPGAVLSCHVVGSGPPVVFLHGFSQNNSIFEEFEKLLAQHHMLILLDSRGHGASGLGQDAVTIKLMAEDVLDVLDYLGLEKNHVIGFSDGANIAMQLAINHPERVSGIVAISGNITPDGLKQRVRFGIKAWRLVLKLGSMLGVKAACKQLKLIPLLLDQPRIKPQELGSISCPAFMIWAENDFISREHIALVGENIPGAKVLVVEKTGHLSVIRKWKKYADDIEKFLNTGGKTGL